MSNHFTSELYFERDWTFSHLIEAPTKIISFFEGDGISLKGKRILDAGTGDGLIAASLGKMTDNQILGIDIHEFDQTLILDTLGREYQKYFQYQRVTESDIWDIPENYFDIVTLWSVTEHVFDMDTFLKNIHRVLKPEGKLFLQQHPFWESRWGHHLYEWLPEFYHLNHSREDCISYFSQVALSNNPIKLSTGEYSRELPTILDDRKIDFQSFTKTAMASFDSCNKISFDQLMQALQENKLSVAKIEIMSGAMHLPPHATKISGNVIEGVYLIANPIK
jgi:cyclopropane fatty-acyl-phospholipid synthase-like methyltransferase